MKATAILNGSIKIVIEGENEMEDAMLNQFSKQTIEVVTITKAMPILDKVVSKGLIFQQKGRIEE